MKTEPTGGMKRYTLVLPGPLYSELEVLAGKHQITMVELLRRFIKLGLKIAAATDSDTASLILREDGHEREIMVLL